MLVTAMPHGSDSDDEDDETDDDAWLERSFQVEDFIRLRALLALEGEYPSEGNFDKV